MLNYITVGNIDVDSEWIEEAIENIMFNIALNIDFLISIDDIKLLADELIKRLVELKEE